MGRHILRFFEECQRQNIGDGIVQSLMSPHLAVGRVLPELMRASKGRGNNVEVGEHHALWFSQQGVAKSSESV